MAGIAAGGADGYAGSTPLANLVAIDVMDDSGVARTSDVIAACQWILANKSTYNIRIANFSLHSATKGNFVTDPLDKAVEKLWFNGVVVVAAAGNYGTAGAPSGVPYAPGNDPFVITVGAIDIGDASFDAVSWSSVSWSSVSWHDVSWNDVSWASVSWNDSSYEDAAEGDANHDGGYDLTPEEAAALLADPDLAPAPDSLPPSVTQELDQPGG